MKFRNILNMLVCLLFLFAHPVWSQQSEQTVMQMKDVRSWNIHRLSDQDVLLTICSIQWGTPDRWSITSRYLHGGKKDRDDQKWLNGFSITLSPGTAGGRLGIGYWGMYLGEVVALPFEVRGVLLRTWGNPLSTLSNRTFIGAEFRIGYIWLINLGIGYYTQISSSKKDREQFYGFHFGVGI